MLLPFLGNTYMPSFREMKDKEYIPHGTYLKLLIGFLVLVFLAPAVSAHNEVYVYQEMPAGYGCGLNFLRSFLHFHLL